MSSEVSFAIPLIDAATPEAQLCQAVVVALANAGEITPPAPSGFIHFLNAALVGTVADNTSFEGVVRVVKYERVAELCGMPAYELAEALHLTSGFLVMVKLTLREGRFIYCAVRLHRGEAAVA